MNYLNTLVIVILFFGFELIVEKHNSKFKRLVASLFSEPVKLVNVDEVDKIDQITVSTKEAFLNGMISERLFMALAPRREDRTKVYGPGNEDADMDLSSLIDELSCLARTGSYDLDILLKGENTLQCLLSGLLKIEDASKQFINPRTATVVAQIEGNLRDSAKKVREDPGLTSCQNDRLLALFSGAVNSPQSRGAESITPDEIDCAQFNALYEYQSTRNVRVALESVLEVVRTINKDHGIEDRVSGRS